MAVTEEKLNTAIAEAERFIAKAIAAKRRFKEDKYASFGNKDTGAVRRASMDLTNVLVELRK